jgi:bifunctional NMN adenylyltransferase/nudix hydrolase
MKDNITDIGVIVGRFQIDKLHEGHIALLDHVTNLHNKVVVFLGVASGEHKEDQALEYATREKMIKSAYPSIITMPLPDIHDDELWSKNLDNKVREVFTHGSVTLYGGRDSFIPHYSGRFRCEEISNAIEQSATARRNQIKREVRDTEDFRAGILYHAANSYPNVFPCVDSAIIKEGENPMILVARKPNEKLYRFPGGHVDPEDSSYEAAAKREAKEECGNIELGKPEYVTSMKVDDWRYRSSKNKITTALYKMKYLWGNISANDDIVECKWMAASELLEEGSIVKNIVPEHRELMIALLGNLGLLKEKNQEMLTN